MFHPELYFAALCLNNHFFTYFFSNYSKKSYQNSKHKQSLKSLNNIEELKPIFNTTMKMLNCNNKIKSVNFVNGTNSIATIVREKSNSNIKSKDVCLIEESPFYVHKVS